MDCKYNFIDKEDILCEGGATRRKKKGKWKHESTPVMEIGKLLAETSRGLFSPDDWQCSKCGNVNWARRQRCNICNAPKYSKQEERTGIGGGYDDRGVVEYVERDYSDEEYDHFGRRKRKQKRRKKEFGGKQPGSNSEDDSEDGDLSKYDLSVWSDSGSVTEKDSSKL